MSEQKIPRRFELCEHKRELFDLMRAYHTSEISHVGHGITILLAILAASISAIGLYLTYPMVLPPPWKCIVFFLIAASSILVTIFTQKKIDADHERYMEYRRSYERLVEHMGFTNLILKGEAIIIVPFKESNGAKVTKDSFYVLSCIVLFSAILGWAIPSQHAEQGDPNLSCEYCNPHMRQCPCRGGTGAVTDSPHRCVERPIKCNCLSMISVDRDKSPWLA